MKEALKAEGFEGELLDGGGNTLTGQDAQGAGQTYELHVHTQHGGDTVQYISSVLSARSDRPPDFADLPADLDHLSQPLPVVPSIYRRLSSMPRDQQALAQLGAPLQSFSSGIDELAAVVSAPLVYYGEGSQLSKAPVSWAVHPLVICPMAFALGVLGLDYDVAGSKRDQSGKRPDMLLLLKSVLMFKAQLKDQATSFGVAQMDLLGKMANWTPHLHGNREYMLCLAAAGKRLRFFAVLNGGTAIKRIAPEFNLADMFDRLRVMHASLRVLTIMLQQREHQLPSTPLPLGAGVYRSHSQVTYYGDHVEKAVHWATFANNDAAALQRVYAALRQLPDGPGGQHPRGLLRPRAAPVLSRGKWRVEFPLGTPLPPADLRCLRLLVADVLHGLAALHALSIVHRDVRMANVLQVGAGSYALIDYEHGGLADQVPRYAPLQHWPPECRTPGAAYTRAADVYSVGQLMRRWCGHLDAEAEAFCSQLLAPPGLRPSADDALRLPWLAA